jgi:hypothetical protein
MKQPAAYLALLGPSGYFQGLHRLELEAPTCWKQP